MNRTKERILSAALLEFADKGYEGATTKGIADRAGFREITLFRHFGSKENLLKQVLKEKSVVLPSIKLFENACEKSPRELLQELGRRFFTQLLAREKMVRLMMLEAGNRQEIKDELAQIPKVIQEHLAHYLKGVMDRGLIKKGDPDLMALAFLSLFFSLVVGKEFLPLPQATPQEIADEFVTIFLSGIEVRN